jgi:hypothetical protein
MGSRTGRRPVHYQSQASGVRETVATQRALFHFEDDGSVALSFRLKLDHLVCGNIWLTENDPWNQPLTRARQLPHGKPTRFILNASTRAQMDRLAL